MKPVLKKLAPFILLAVSLVFIGVGLLRGEHQTVLEKAINICMECIGIG
ncbi:MAG: hypothetical protein KBS85_07575 [Lachnospiraceae bacterium]|nr:hypothetical protein [Candidatus Merdinaster equi]